MEPIIPTSFIPKRPVSSEPIAPIAKSRAVGLLSFLTVIIVIATIASYGGVYLYGKQLKSEELQLQKDIATARDGLGSDFVSDMKRLNLRIEGVKDLIKDHIVVTPIFTALQETTLQSVQYKSFNYTFTTDLATKTDMVEVALSGTAKNYATLALQSDAFAKNPLIKNPVFANLSIDEKTNRVNFRLTFTVNASDLAYQRFVDGLSAQQQQAVPVPPQPNIPTQ